MQSPHLPERYAYDGLQRLIGATENPGVSYAYTYDLAGNRTDGGKTYNAANQISNAGYSYDNAGNLTNDGSATYSYDALSRMTARGATSYSYNGDGVLVYDGTTRSTQDLAAPLSQVLQTTQGSATTQYLYGIGRLASVAGSTRMWYGTDALGSVRQTLSDIGAPLSAVNYDPWGTPESGSVPTFGFTGEVQDSATGLVNLRARWYSTGRGRFTSVDPFAGDPTRPYSQHQYQYGYSDPVLNSDPSGRIVPGVCPIGYTWDKERQGCVDDPNFPSWLSFLKGQMPLLPGPVGVQSGGKVAVEVGDKVLVEPLKNFAVEVSAEACKSALPIWARVTALALAGVTAVGGALAPAVPPAKQSAGGYVTVYRFADRNNPGTISSNLSRQPQSVQDAVRRLIAKPGSSLLESLLITHAALGPPPESPFVSVLLDHARGSRTPDPWLATIIWGQPGVPGKDVKRAPDLGEFRVPADRLLNPGNNLSTNETEKLFLGDDLGNFLVRWLDNPYYGPRPPPAY